MCGRFEIHGTIEASKINSFSYNDSENIGPLAA
jgi:hypothetical protein